MPELRIAGLTKRYGSTPVLQGLDLTVRDGEFLTLLGASGCGKSTLLKLIAGLEVPDEGTIHVGDTDLAALSPSERNCAMVFQSYALYPHMTVGGNIRTPLLMRNLRVWERFPGAALLLPSVRRRRASAETTAREVASSLGIDALWSRKPAQLSGGQRQRVALARAMVRRPSVFLFDEPLSNLDANLRQALREEIRELHAKLGATFIYVTHDQHEAMSMSDRVAVMREGRILQVGTPREIYDEPADLEVSRFVGAPRINVLEARVDAGGTLEVLGRRVHVAGAPAGSVRVAFRPQAVRQGTAGGIALDGTVSAAEYTGAELIVTCALDAASVSVVACLPAGTQGLRPGVRAQLHVPAHALQLFDAAGQRVAIEVRGADTATARPAAATAE